MLQLRAWLPGSEPEIWRRLVVDPRLTLEQLHTVLQVSFGWENCHLHQFHGKDGVRYGRPWAEDPEVIDERKILLDEIFDRANRRIEYEYDFGDGWMHTIKLEKRVDSEKVEYPPEAFVRDGKGVFSGKKRAAVCLAGERAGPPEDCGGIGGYEALLELKRMPKSALDEEDEERLEWLGDWDAEHFSLAVVNPDLGRVRVKKAHGG